MTGRSTLPPIPKPSPTEVKKHLAIRDTWIAGKIDTALETLFATMPHNTDAGQVAVKSAALNGLYSTSIRAVTQMASHITSLDIDKRLAEPAVNPDLVEDIARFEIGGTVRRNYSFATKFCAFHRPDLYPIYDTLVAGVLNTLLRQGEKFDTFQPGESWRGDYAVWCRSLNKFRTHFSLEDFSIRQIDKYLWTLAKERQSL